MSLVFSKQITHCYTADVFIAGGGPAGCAAALAAARSGSKVFLAESLYCLGGQGTAGMVPAFMQFGDGIHFLADGIGREILETMHCLGGEEYKNSHTFAIKAEALKRAYDDLLTDAGVEFCFGLTLIDVVVENAAIQHCVLASKSGLYAVKASIYIDATGDADMAYLAGVPCDKGDEQGRMMAGTLCSLWTGIQWDKRNGSDRSQLERAIEDGVFDVPDLHLPGMWKISEKVGGGNIGHTFEVDGTDERSLTKALVRGRKLMEQYETYYKKYLSGYEDMELVATGAMLGIRETRRIRGVYQLTLQDFLDRADFDDEIGRYCYNVDIHASDNSVSSFQEFMKDHTGYRYKTGENYGIPYRVLLPLGVDNLLVAGRCVSADRPMQSSIRVMPGCYITGQAAGVAASECVQKSVLPKDANIRNIQGMLKDMGMYLPNFCK